MSGCLLAKLVVMEGGGSVGPGLVGGPDLADKWGKWGHALLGRSCMLGGFAGVLLPS